MGCEQSTRGKGLSCLRTGGLSGRPVVGSANRMEVRLRELKKREWKLRERELELNSRERRLVDYSQRYGHSISNSSSSGTRVTGLGSSGEFVGDGELPAASRKVTPPFWALSERFTLFDDSETQHRRESAPVPHEVVRAIMVPLPRESRHRDISAGGPPRQLRERSLSGTSLVTSVTGTFTVHNHGIDTPTLPDDVSNARESAHSSASWRDDAGATGKSSRHGRSSQNDDVHHQSSALIVENDDDVASLGFQSSHHDPISAAVSPWETCAEAASSVFLHKPRNIARHREPSPIAGTYHRQHTRGVTSDTAKPVRLDDAERRCVLEIFRQFDRHGRKAVTKADALTIVESDEGVELMFRDCDLNDDGFITEQEFLIFMERKKVSGDLHPHLENLLEIVQEAARVPMLDASDSDVGALSKTQRGSESTSIKLEVDGKQMGGCV